MVSFAKAPACRAASLAMILALGSVFACGLAPASAQSPQPKAAPAAAAPKAPAPKAQEAPAPAPTVEKVNAYFNSLKMLQANFVQMAPDGRSYAGILYLARPGRMRFEYHPPATLEIVSDGRSVAIRDRKLNTQDVYFIGQTPLKFLLQPKIDVAKDSKVTGLVRNGNDIVLSLEDKSTLGGTSKIKVVFDAKDHALREWTVTDPQGHDTRVVLTNLNLTAKPDLALFVINEQQLVNPN